MTKTKERVGLLFVHGIGEQKRFEFLKESVGQFAELMKQSEGPGETFSCMLIDKTTDWKAPPDQPSAKGPSPITLTLESASRILVFECREVWWADLGARSDIFDAIKFWLWGFGAYCAPIYRDLDAAGLEKSKYLKDGTTKLTKPASVLVKLPDSIAGLWWPEISGRIMLGLAGIATMFVAISWVIAKRLFSAALKEAPTPTLIVSYVGDVRTYEERATPGDTALSDPGYPRRVGIRRRMVTEMVAMGARTDLDRWYVVAHSQGTVVAYNGLTEIGHALPNYLSQSQWQRLDATLKSDAGCQPRPTAEIPKMMPGRPWWLGDEDVINRPLLFRNLRGFLTYGSPLNKFAAIWPRIVATATDRNDGKNPFDEKCLWLNLEARQDPVAGDVRRFYQAETKKRPTFDGCIPPIANVQTPLKPNVLISHLRYFDVAEDFAKERPAITQRHAVMRWLMNAPTKKAEEAVDDIGSEIGKLEGLKVAIYYAIAILLTVCAATTFVTFGGNLLDALFFTEKPKAFTSASAFFGQVPGNILWLLAASLLVMSLAGFIRWIGESGINARIATQENAPEVVALNKAQVVAGWLTLIVVVILFGVSLAACEYLRCRWAVACLELGLMLPWAGILVQSGVNKWKFIPLRIESAPAGKAAPKRAAPVEGTTKEL